VTYALVHWQMHGSIVWSYFLGCLTSAMMWIPLTLLLQALRHPRTDPDDL
jgi:rod shape-determining protein MreD